MKPSLPVLLVRLGLLCSLWALADCAAVDRAGFGLCDTDADCPSGQVCRGNQCGEPAGNDGGAAADGGSARDGGLGDGGGSDDAGVSADAGVVVDAGPLDGGAGFGFGERCQNNADCQSQICLQTGRISFCTRRCSEDCPSDYECKAYVLDRDRIVALCTPFSEVYCVRCNTSSECAKPGDTCTDVGGANYCTKDCSQTGACAPDFECRDVPYSSTVEGHAALADGGLPPDAATGVVRQCMPRGGKCPGCIDRDGDGYGVGADCLGPDCNDNDPAIHPGAAEVCDGVDNNCDGRIDEGFELRSDNNNCGVCGRVCAQGRSCCEGTCVDTQTSPTHCGVCNNGCTADGAECCGGSCHNTRTEAAHCGGCGLACTNVHGDVACALGSCAPDCARGFGDCDRDARNGCETALSTPDNCGACGLTCTNTNGVARCANSRCDPTCNDGFGDCDGNPNNGCEQNVRFNTGLHCGACNAPCVNTHGLTSCQAGACLPVCDSNFGDCDGQPRNGCETDLRTSTANCGACNHSCSTANASNAACVDSQCRLTCNPGFYDCNQDPTDGCEANLALVATCGACVLDLDCPADFYCRDNQGTKVCTKKKPLGDPCALGAAPTAPGRECQGGQCIDGVCCESSCQGACRACNIVGSRGFCSFLPIGAPDPRAQCTAQPAATCGKDGTCDGAGGCRLHTSGTLCEAQSCVEALQSNPRTCDGLGTCRTAIPPTTLCSPYLCNGAGCFTACDVNNPVQCAAGYACVGGICKVAGGQTCTTNPQCASGFCVDGVCCNNKCDGVCARCDLAGKVGECSPIPTGSDPDNECPTDSESTCGRTGFCSGSGSCSLYPAGTQCQSRTCSIGTQTNAKFCDGTGTCQTPTPATASCFPFICNSSASACFATCTADAQCASGYGCAPGGVCRKVGGSACGGDGECASGFCADGVCCEGRCGGLCEKCSQPGRLGFCDPIAAGQDPDNECAAADVSTCGLTGVCSGQRSCQQWPSGTVCVAGSCSADGLGLNRADTCNGSGSCVDQGLQSCAPYRCNAGAPAACRTTCTIDSQCATGYLCKTSTGQCLRADGQSCSGSADCLNGACCSGLCRNLANDTSNCGTCNQACTNANGSTSCVGGACSPVCNTNFKSCDSNPNNGCETASNTNTNCGTCGTACARANASATCATGACAIASCAAGFDNCDGVDGNGCETQHNVYANICGAAEDVGASCGDTQHACGFLNAQCCDGQYTAFATSTGRTSKWFKARSNECSSALFCTGTLFARVTLQSPPGADYDLYVYSDCGTVIGSSLAGTGAADVVEVQRADTAGTTDSFDYWVEVRYYGGASCTNWTLTFEGKSQ